MWISKYNTECAYNKIKNHSSKNLQTFNTEKAINTCTDITKMLRIIVICFLKKHKNCRTEDKTEIKKYNSYMDLKGWRW
jgi:hypothetical protein